MLGKTYSRREILAASERVIAGARSYHLIYAFLIALYAWCSGRYHYITSSRARRTCFITIKEQMTRGISFVYERWEDDARAPRWWASAGAREMRILKRQLPHLTTLSSPRLYRCSSIISIEINIFKEANNLTLDTLWCSGLGCIFGACHN